MISQEVADRYANALFALAKSKDQIDAVLSDLETISDLLEKNKEAKEFLESPQIMVENKKKVLQSVFQGKINQDLFYFLLLLLEKRRIEYISDIAREFEQLVKEFHGVIEAQVVTAVSLEEYQTNSLKQKLERKTNKKIQMKLIVEPKIIGGVIVSLRNQIIDRSIRRGLDVLKEKMCSIKVY